VSRTGPGASPAGPGPAPDDAGPDDAVADDAVGEDAVAGEAAGVSVSGVTKSFDGATRVLDGVDVGVPAGRTLALLGPSGCGKTTLLRIIAGLELPDDGTVSVGERVVSGPGTFVPPERRRVGMVFQDWALFPHLTVARNVGFGLERPERRASPRIDESLQMVGLTGLGDRMPSTLSGGQQQRVALARAIAPRPSVLLLDEPFSNLDAALRARVRTEIHALLVDLGVTTVFVTHDQDEAFVLGDRVAVMAEGRVVQAGDPAEVYLRPASRWVADFVGDANFVPGTAAGATAATALGPVELHDPAEGAVDVLVRPEHLDLEPATGADDGRPSATVELVEYVGHDTTYLLGHDGRLGASGAPLRVRLPSSPRFGRGDAVVVRHRGGAAQAFPAEP
jgi:iron(III) transport system ATP-binding protein